MTAHSDGVEFVVSRTIVVHVRGCLDAAGIEQLRAILHDLIENQGLNDLMIDLTKVAHATPEIPIALEAAKAQMAARGGNLTLQVTDDPPAPLVDLANALPTFAPVRAGETHLG